MMCRNPYTGVGGVHGCGQCGPCRFNKRRIWAHRIMLEAAQYEHNAFVTLTYDPEHLPAGGTLVPDHTRLWLNRLRGRVAPSRFRFFLVGEYGDDSQRPHYHAALFGFQSCSFGQSRYSKSRQRCCYWCELVRETWGQGNVYLGSLELSSAGYMAGYVTKKMTKVDDARLAGRSPEFGRMSLRPGVGATALWDIADALLRYDLDKSLDDAPGTLRHGSKELPLGRYLQGRLRELIGRDKKAPQAVLDKVEAELRPLRLAARASAEVPGLKAHVIAAGDGAAANLAARSRIRKKRGSL